MSATAHAAGMPHHPRNRAPKSSANAARADEGRNLTKARRRTLAAFERLYVVRHLRRHQGNVASAARQAGIAPSTMRGLIARHRIDPREYLPPSRPRLVVRRRPGDDI